MSDICGHKEFIGKLLIEIDRQRAEYAELLDDRAYRVEKLSEVECERDSAQQDVEDLTSELGRLQCELMMAATTIAELQARLDHPSGGV